MRPFSLVESMKVRILVDIPGTELKCGEYADLPKDKADGLIKAGKADPNAPGCVEVKKRGRPKNAG